MGKNKNKKQEQKGMGTIRRKRYSFLSFTPYLLNTQVISKLQFLRTYVYERTFFLLLFFPTILTHPISLNGNGGNSLVVHFVWLL